MPLNIPTRPVRFQAMLPPKPDKPAVGEQPAPAQAAKKKKFNPTSLLWLAPMCNLIGGPLMIASSLIPEKTSSVPKADPVAIHGPAVPGQKAAQATQPQASPAKITSPTMGTFEQLTPQQVAQTELDLTQLKHTLKWLGWEFVSLGFLGGAISGLAMGYVSKQPGMVLSSASNIATIPFLMMAPDSFALKAMVALSTGPWLTGYANIFRNQNGLKPGEKPREFDMAPLFNNEALIKMQGSAQGNTPTAKEIRKLRRRYVFQMLKYTAKDQLLIAKDFKHAAATGAKNTKAFFKHPKQSLKNGYHEVREALRFIRGKSDTPPKLLQPSVAQNQAAAFLLYAGSLPVLFMVGSVDSVNTMGKSLFTAGSALANLPIWAIGFNKKDQNLIVGVPLMIGGTFTMDTDAGIGAMRLGEAGFMNYLRKEVAKAQTTPSEATPPPPEKTPDPKP